MPVRLLKYLAAAASGILLFWTLSAGVERSAFKQEISITVTAYSHGIIPSQEVLNEREQRQPSHEKARLTEPQRDSTTTSYNAATQPDSGSYFRFCNQSSGKESVARSGRSMFLYAAYLDSDANRIYAYGLSGELQSRATYYCHTWEEPSGEGTCVARATLERVGGQPQGQPGSAINTFSCAPPANTGSRVLKLALIDTNECQLLRHDGGVRVQTTAPAAQQRQAEGKVQFAVCCLPEWDSPADIPVEPENLVSFFEANAFYGAQKFYFYNASDSDKHEPILRRYQSSGRVTIVQWPKSNDPLSLVAAREDCLQRSRAEAKYVVYLSLHDLLLPLSGGLWPDVFNQTLAAKAHAYRIATVQFGVPSLTHCTTRDKTLSVMVSKVTMLQHTLFRGVTTVADDPRFYRTIYNLERTRSHPSYKSRDWYSDDGGATGGKPSVVSVGPLVATALNYHRLPNLSPANKQQRFHPLKYSPLICRHTDAIARAVTKGCEGDCTISP